jgi:phosphomannomutase
MRQSVSIYDRAEIIGPAASGLSPELYRRWGRTLGLQVAPGAKFVAGGDARSSTPDFLAALVAGLCETGLDVVDLGVLPRR